jgi:branched-subunit amino acid aminotransferase/4-amino-4-deoxychorismate lyase
LHCGAFIAAFASKHVTVCLLFVYLRLRLTAAQKTPRMTSMTILNRERREKIAKSKGSVCLITRNLERETGVPGAAIKSLAPPAFVLLLQRAQRRGCSRASQLE